MYFIETGSPSKIPDYTRKSSSYRIMIGKRIL